VYIYLNKTPMNPLSRRLKFFLRKYGKKEMPTQASDGRISACIILLSFFTVCFCSNAIAQNQRVIDSLQNVLKTKHGADRWEPLYELACEYVDNDKDRALQIITEAYDGAKALGDSLKIVKTQRAYASILGGLGMRDEQQSELKAALRTASFNIYKHEMAHILRDLASAHFAIDRYDVALENNFKAVLLYEEVGDSLSVARCFYDVGLVYFKCENFRKAADYLNKSLLKREKIGGGSDLSCLAYLSLCYTFLGELDLADSLLAHAGNKSDNEFSHSILFMSRGLQERARRHLPIAIEYLQKSVQAAHQAADKQQEVRSLVYLASVAMDVRDFRKAKVYLDSATLVSTSTSWQGEEQLKLFEHYAKFYGLTGDHALAGEYNARYLELWTKLFSRNWGARMLDIEAEHLANTFDKELRAKQQLIELRKTLSEKRTELLCLTSLLIFIMIVIVLVLIRRVRKNSAINQILAHKVDERRQYLETTLDAVQSSTALNREIMALNNEIVSKALKNIYAIADAGGQYSNANTKIYFKMIHEVCRNMGALVTAGHEEVEVADFEQSTRDIKHKE
jgi:tetratricopeptide (TPR) repeat protein